MKLYHARKTIGFLMVALFFVVFLYTDSEVAANANYNWTLDLQISTDTSDETSWTDDLGEVLEGTDLDYRIIITDENDSIVFGIGLSALIDTQPFTMTLETTEQPISIGKYPALLGPQISVITGTVISAIGYLGDNGVVITYTVPITSVNPITIVAAASYTGISSAVPEPVTLLLVGSGLFGLWGLRRRFKK